MHGARIDSGQAATGTYATFLLLDGADAEVVGPWVDVRGARAMSLEVEGVAGAEILLVATNAANPRTEHAGQQLGQPITRDGLVALSGVTVAAMRALTTRQTSPVTVRLHVAW
jgi:hypothetical protein